MERTVLLAAFLLLLSCSAENNDTAPILDIVAQQSGYTSSFRGAAVRNDLEAWVSGTEGTVLKTNNGGKSWQKINVPGTDSLDFRDIELLGNETVLLMSAGPGTASRIYKSNDSGQNWKLVYRNEHEKGFFNGFDFWDERSGMLIGDAIDGKLYLLKTGDGGGSWKRVGEQTLPDLSEGEYGFAASGTGIFTGGEKNVWIATGGTIARVFYSDDRGATWQVRPTPMVSGKASTGSFSVVFKNDRMGIAVGGDYAADSIATGNVILTGDGGRSWAGIGHPETMPFKSCVVYLGNDSFLALGTSGISITHDNGHSWSGVDNTSFHTMDYNRETGVGWMAGGGGKIARFSYKTVEN